MTEQERLDEKERLIHDDLCSIENKVRHAFNQGFELGLKQKQRHSKWVNIIQVFNGSRYAYECQWCKCQYPYPYNYCPNCGSKMVKNDD